MANNRFTQLPLRKRILLILLMPFVLFVAVECFSALIYYTVAIKLPLFHSDTPPKPTLYRMVLNTFFTSQSPLPQDDPYSFPYFGTARGFGRFVARRGYDPWLSYRPVPQSEFMGLGVDRYGFYHNGDPNREIGVKKNNVFRIVMLGGSTIAGLGVTSNQDTIAAQLEQALNIKSSQFSGRHFEVINAGVQGFNSSQEMILFALELVHYEPDMVITFDCWNERWSWPYDSSTYIPHRKDYHHKLARFFVAHSMGAQNYWEWINATYLTFLHPDRFFTGRLFKPLLKRASSVIPQETGGKYEIHYYPDSLRYYRANLINIAGMARFHGMYSLHFLQPNLSWKKNQLTASERAILDEAGRAFPKGNREQEIRKYWTALDEMFGELKVKYQGDPKIRFELLDDLFLHYPGEIYVDTGHYNVTGNMMIAEKMKEVIQKVLQ